MGKVQRAKVNKETNERYCVGCDEWYEQTKEFWIFRVGKIRSNYCKKCYNELHPKNGNPEEAGMLLRPGEFKNQIQKEKVAEFLQKLGWRYNEPKKLWWKPGIRDENGDWPNMPPDTPKTGSHKLTDEERLEIINTYQGNVEDVMSKYNVTKHVAKNALYYAPKTSKVLKDVPRDAKGRILYRSRIVIPYRPRMSKEEIEEIIEMYEAGKNLRKIAEEMDRSTTAIRYQLKKFYDELSE